MRSPTHLCKDCGNKIRPRKLVKGSIIIELLLWGFGLLGLLFTFGISLLIPLIYSIWRVSSKYKACPECESTTFIPLNSPAAKAIESDLLSPQPILTSSKIPVPESKTERYKL